MKKNIHEMTNVAEVLAINPDKIDWILAPEEFWRIAEILGAIWRFNYVARENGLFGCHALLKSGLHSDFFFSAKEMLRYENILKLLARQLAFLFSRLGIVEPDWIAGIPTGATELAKEVAELLGSRCAELEKIENQIEFKSTIGNAETLIWVEDVCTRGTAIRQAYTNLAKTVSMPVDYFYLLTLVNRSGIEKIELQDNKIVKVISLIKLRANDWTKEECPLCPKSVAIKPKETPRNWELITNAQKL